MKKLFVLVLALMFAFGMVGSAFALDIDKNTKGNANLEEITQINSAGQNAKIDQDADAKSGYAIAQGNASYTVVCVDQSAKGNKGITTNFSEVTVTNEGKAIAKSGDAVAFNINNGDIDQKIDQKNYVDKKVDQSIKVDDKDKKKKDDKKKKWK